jgi:3-oxoacyl-[acyl-carrier-protein] synthase II
MILGEVDGARIEGHRVVVTGVGAVSACGVGAGALFEGLVNATFTEDRSVPDFDPTAWFGPKEVRRVDRFAQLAVAAGAEAVEDASLVVTDPWRVATIFGTGIGGMQTLTAQTNLLRDKGADRVSPFLAPMMMPNAGGAQLAMRYGFQGPAETITTACAAGTHAIAYAARLVASGRVDAAVAGGSESVLDPVAYAGFRNMTALSTSGISRPFDAARDGFVMAEGAGALVLETLEHAEARGARIYAEILGAASTADAFHITAPREDGAGALRCMELALEDAGLRTDDVGNVNAHGTSTPLNDLAESKAIAALFGEQTPPVTSAKGVTGHSLGGAGALEAVGSVLTIEHGLIPQTVGTTEVDPEIHIDVVIGEPRPLAKPVVLSNSFGFGGHNGCLVIGRRA